MTLTSTGLDADSRVIRRVLRSPDSKGPVARLGYLQERTSGSRNGVPHLNIHKLNPFVEEPEA